MTGAHTPTDHNVASITQVMRYMLPWQPDTEGLSQALHIPSNQILIDCSELHMQLWITHGWLNHSCDMGRVKGHQADGGVHVIGSSLWRRGAHSAWIYCVSDGYWRAEETGPHWDTKQSLCGSMNCSNISLIASILLTFKLTLPPAPCSAAEGLASRLWSKHASPVLWNFGNDCWNRDHHHPDHLLSAWELRLLV